MKILVALIALTICSTSHAKFRGDDLFVQQPTDQSGALKTGFHFSDVVSEAGASVGPDRALVIANENGLDLSAAKITVTRPPVAADGLADYGPIYHLKTSTLSCAFQQLRSTTGGRGSGNLRLEILEFLNCK